MDWQTIVAIVGVSLVFIGGVWKLASAIGENTALTKQILANQTKHEVSLDRLDVIKNDHSVRLEALETWRELHDRDTIHRKVNA